MCINILREHMRNGTPTCISHLFITRTGRRLARREAAALMRRIAVQAKARLSEDERIDVSPYVLRPTFLRKLVEANHPGTKVGHYVPFYFCPRSVMLYILYMGNHPELTYRGGQRPIVHLQIDVAQAVAWANKAGIRWAFSDCNAGARYAVFYDDLADLDQINWQAVHAHDFCNPQIKDGKQAEFLLYELVPFSLIEKIGVRNEEILQQIDGMLGEAGRNLAVSVERSWYF